MIPEFLQETPIIGIFRFVQWDLAIRAAAAAVRGGITALEVTMNSEHPERVIASLREQVPAATVGAGTIMHPDQVTSALAAGAQFIVSPHCDEAIVQASVNGGLPVFPGAATAGEVWRAHRAGATMVKLFPAGSLGSGYVRALRGPFPQIDLLVTGGIDRANLPEFLAAGAAGAGIGGRLFPSEALSRGDTETIEQEAAHLVGIIRRHQAA